jgi:hypothetical protein
MPRAQGRTGNKASKQLAAIDQLLIAAIRQGPAKKRDAINRILELVPGWTREDCWERIRHLRKTREFAGTAEDPPNKANGPGAKGPVRRRASTSPSGPWTPAHDDKLFQLAGYEPVKKIARRLGRSERAVRCRLAALGISAKVTDGWSLRGLRKMLRVDQARLTYLIGTGMLRVRDPRISASSLAVLCDNIRASLHPSTIERIAADLANGDDAYSWDRAADLLGVSVAQIQAWISAGQLRVVDTFVTDRSFEEFCKNHGKELKASLIDPPTAKWLASEYGVSEVAANGGSISRARKHALVIRTCKCGKQIAGNPYFRHLRVCPSAGAAGSGDPSNKLEPSSRTSTSVQSSRSTYKSASLRQSSKEG